MLVKDIYIMKFSKVLAKFSDFWSPIPFHSLLHPKFHPHWCNMSFLQGEKPQNCPLSNLNTGTLHCTQCC